MITVAYKNKIEAKKYITKRLEKIKKLCFRKLKELDEKNDKLQISIYFELLKKY